MNNNFIIIFFVLIFSYCSFGQFPNIRVSSPAATTPEEVTIAINPTNPMNIAAGANITFYYYSTDGGFTWTEGHLVSSLGVWGDPCTIFDADGNLFFAHLSNPPFPGSWIDRIVVQKSTDGGRSWNDGKGIWVSPPKKQDKEWLAADMTYSPYRNTLHAAWTEFDAYGSSNPSDSTRILFSRSTDTGDSWFPPVRISDVGGNCVDGDSTVEGAVPAIGPNGEVYLSWSGPLGIMFDKSTDGGQSFGTDIFVTAQPGGWDFAIPGIYRANGMPVTTCDVSTSAYRGNIYINWSDQRNGEDNTDIFFIKSTDGGQTWGSVKMVNDDIGQRHQFFCWMTIDQSNGNIYVVFYDRRNWLDNSTDVYMAKSTDGGETFINFKVSETSFTPAANVFFGDYTNIAALNGKVYPIWMRMDGGALSVWTALVEEERSTEFAYDSSWNMISVPMQVRDPRKTTLFPMSTSFAFSYEGQYSIVDTLKHGVGYWLKYPSSGVTILNGFPVSGDTFNVKAGWNMIGSISRAIPVSSIGSMPAGIVTSDFFTYQGAGYAMIDSILPGKGYWVKANQNGKIILSAESSSIVSHRIQIKPDEELPPLPPNIAEQIIPDRFSLEQNYPNPFNPKTEIRYQLGERSWVTLKIFNILGQEVVTLVDGMQDAGFKKVEFDARRVQSGVYYYECRTSQGVETKKMTLIR